MQHRVLKYMDEKSTGVPWLGTFHSISVKFLRRHAEAVGLKGNFTILDTSDQKKIVRNISKAEDKIYVKITPELILSTIDKWKNKGLLPIVSNMRMLQVRKINLSKFIEFIKPKLIDLNACDFGDLILYCVKLFENNSDIKKIYNNNFKYILVDEFQDTNFIQNKWLNLLVNENPKYMLCR